MTQTQHLQTIVIDEKVSIKHKLCAIIKRRKRPRLQAKLHRYRAHVTFAA